MHLLTSCRLLKLNHWHFTKPPISLSQGSRILANTGLPKLTNIYFWDHLSTLRSYFEDRNTTPRVDKGKGALISISFGASLSQIFNVASLATEINLTYSEVMWWKINIKKPREGACTYSPLEAASNQIGHISHKQLTLDHISLLVHILFTGGNN